MISVIVALVLRLAGNQVPSGAVIPPGELLIGSWVLVSREDRTADTGVVPEPNLGSDALGLLVYDRAGNVAAQLMRRSRPARSAAPTPSAPQNLDNSGSIDGYDAYFGTYTLEVGSHVVTHHLLGALLPGDIGKTLTRHFEVSEKDLRLWFETTGASGQRVVRTLVWKRSGTRETK